MADTDLEGNFFGYGGGLVAMSQGKVWGALTPRELIAKLDAKGYRPETALSDCAQ